CPTVAKFAADLASSGGRLLSLASGRFLEGDEAVADYKTHAVLRNVYVREAKMRQKAILQPLVKVHSWRVVGWRCDLCGTLGEWPRFEPVAAPNRQWWSGSLEEKRGIDKLSK